MAQINLEEMFFRLRQGDREAFTQIYTELKVPVYTIICRILLSRELAEDVTQELFLKLFISPPDSSVRNPRAFVFKMAHNLSIDALRKHSREDFVESLPITDDSMQNMALRMDLETALLRLPDAEREIVSMHLNGALSFREIAQIMRLSIPAIYRRYRKAIKTVQDYLNGGAV